MTIEQNKTSMRRAIEEGYNQGNLAVFDELMAPNVVSPTLPPPYKSGLVVYKEYVKATRTAFPDMHFVIDDLIAEGDKVVARFTWTGTHKGPLPTMPTIPPTFKKVTNTGIVIARCDEKGKAVELTGELNDLSLLQQLGVVPIPA